MGPALDRQSGGLAVAHVAVSPLAAAGNAEVAVLQLDAHGVGEVSERRVVPSGFAEEGVDVDQAVTVAVYAQGVIR